MTIRLAIICLLGGVVGHLLAKQAMGYIDSKSITDIKDEQSYVCCRVLYPLNQQLQETQNQLNSCVNALDPEQQSYY
jgi:hypothetical protein